MNDIFKLQTGTRINLCSRFAFQALGLSSLFILQGCAIFTTRPVQLMSDSSAALRAARDAQADTLAPDVFRQASGWFFRARNEYKIKNFDLAEAYALKARKYAEQAEFNAIRAANASGGADSALPPPPPPASGDTAATNPTSAAAEPIPNPTGTPIDEFEKRKAEEKPLPPLPDAGRNGLAPIPNPPSYITTPAPLAQPSGNPNSTR